MTGSSTDAMIVAGPGPRITNRDVIRTAMKALPGAAQHDFGYCLADHQQAVSLEIPPRPSCPISNLYAALCPILCSSR